MAARLTPKQAKRLGLDLSSAGDNHRTKKEQEVGGTPGSVTPRQPRLPYHTRCRTCDEHFTSMADETRHMTAANHHAFELVLS